MLRRSMVTLLILGVESLELYDLSSRWCRLSVGCTRESYTSLGSAGGSFWRWDE